MTAPSLILALMLGAAQAQVPPPVEAAAAEAPSQGLSWVTDLRSEYIAGDTIVVTFDATNNGADLIKAPDLSSRSWLATFVLKTPQGTTRKLKTTPPAADPGTLVSIAPRGKRRTLLEIPTSGALEPGQYTLGIELEGSTGVQALPSHSFTIAPAQPVAGSADAGTSPLTAREFHTLWVHKAGEGYQLYLHQSEATVEGKALGDWYLTSTTTAVKPMLAVSQVDQTWDRHLVWAESDKRLLYARLGSWGLRDEAIAVGVPWPKVTTLGRPATDGKGALHQVLWVPAPKGDRGELRILSIGERGVPQFARAGLLDAPPSSVRTVVDDAGAAHFVVVGAQSIDLFTLRDTALPAGRTEPLPMTPKRIIKAQAGETLLGARFSTLPETPEHAGGLAILALVGTAEGVSPRWVSLKGQEIKRLPPVAGAAGTVLDFQPRAYEAPGLLLATEPGKATWQVGTTTKAVVLPANSWALQVTNDGSAVLRSLGSNSPVVQLPL